jgi:hypothetical protein
MRDRAVFGGEREMPSNCTINQVTENLESIVAKGRVKNCFDE